jgi:hypothetical protein
MGKADQIAGVLIRRGVEPAEASEFGQALEQARGPQPLTRQDESKLTLAVGRAVYHGRLQGLQGTMGEVARDLLEVLM